jgi:hypothetical protein
MASWDPGKNRINQKRHSLSFETAQLVFDDPFAVTAENGIDDHGEMRYQTLGLVGGLLIFVAHVQRVIDGEETSWIISARKAVKNEDEIYRATRGKV